MKNTLLILILSLFFFSCKEKSTSPIEEEGEFDPASVSISSLVNHVDILSGVQSFSLDSATYTITSRNKFSEGNNLAAEYIESQLNEYGYTVENQWFSETGRNLIVTKYGRNYPHEYIILCAHYDSMPSEGNAPGADDNASGTALVLEAARLFKSMRLSYSVIFAFWDEEEYGFLGSGYYAGRAVDSLEIHLVLNADMIAYDHDNDNIMGLYNSTSESTTPYVESIEQINNDYNFYIDLHRMNSYASSDDRAFGRVGFNSIGFVEIHTGADRTDINPYWHSSEDTIDKFNLNFYERMCRLLITSLVKISDARVIE